MEYYVPPTRRNFDQVIYILHVVTNDFALNGTPKEITEYIANRTASLKTAKEL